MNTGTALRINEISITGHTVNWNDHPRNSLCKIPSYFTWIWTSFGGKICYSAVSFL